MTHKKKVQECYRCPPSRERVINGENGISEIAVQDFKNEL